jgi:hypothetical protein
LTLIRQPPHSVRRGDYHAGQAFSGRCRFDAAEITDEVRLERRAEAAAAPDHYRDREEKPPEVVAGGQEADHGFWLT